MSTTTTPTIRYPWHKPGGGPTPDVLWVCTACGEAFWAADHGPSRRYSCMNANCPKHRIQDSIRRATPDETQEAQKHVRVGEGAKPTLFDRQVAAVRRFQEAHGVSWKARLYAVWMNGNYGPNVTEDDRSDLQQLRNNSGGQMAINKVFRSL